MARHILPVFAVLLLVVVISSQQQQQQCCIEACGCCTTLNEGNTRCHHSRFSGLTGSSPGLFSFIFGLIKQALSIRFELDYCEKSHELYQEERFELMTFWL